MNKTIKYRKKVYDVLEAAGNLRELNALYVHAVNHDQESGMVESLEIAWYSFSDYPHVTRQRFAADEVTRLYNYLKGGNNHE